MLQIVGHPRDSKRIKMLQDEGFHMEAVAFERDYHKGRVPTCRVVSLGKIQHGKYVSRLLKFIKALPIIRSAVERNDVVYASGQDMAFLAYVAGIGLNKPIIMEVGDLVDIQLSSSIKSRIFRKMDRWITSRYALLVVISEGFLNTYYRNWLGLKVRGLVIQNKLEWVASGQNRGNTQDMHSGMRPLIDRPLKIGYFGLLRDYWSWQVLSTLAARYSSRFEIIFAGLPINPSNLGVRLADSSNMKFIGEYRSPEDLPHIYGKVDMIWACYPEIKDDDWNLRWGRPNRFYESCFFGTPCFARAGSLFAEDVERYNIGSLIHDTDVQIVVEQIAQINHDDFVKWRKGMSELPRELYLYTNEGHLLASEIMELRKIRKVNHDG